MEENRSVKEKAREVFVRQRDPSEGGMACLASVIRYYDGEISRERLWDLSDASPQGTTLLGLHQAAEHIGLEAGAFRADLKNLMALDAPCILHITNKEGREHYVVCYGFERKCFILGDPAIGVQECSPTKLKKRWQSKVLLTLEPTDDFEEKIAHLAALSPSATGKQADERYRCADVTLTPFGGYQAAARARRSGATRILPSVWAQLLRALDRFDTLEGHATTCLQMLDRGDAAGNVLSGFDVGATDEKDRSREKIRAHTLRQLTQFAEEGLLVSEGDIRSDILALRSTDGVQATPTTITSVGIPTRNRTACLKRALTSYIKNSWRHERTTDFVVVDDSRDAKAQKQNRRVLRKLQKRYGADLFYAHRPQRAHFAERLARRAGIPLAVTRFALLGDERCQTTYGAARNALLLHSVGELCMQVDDDTICAVAASPGARSGLALTSTPETCEYWFFENAQKALDAVSFTDTDFLSVHETLLGKSLSHCIASVAEGELHFDDLDVHFLRNARSPAASITLSFAGAVGDSGMRSNLPRVFSEDDTYERLVHTEPAYQTNLNTRQVLRAPVRPSITNGIACMTMNIGLDNRTLLPPFMPVGRNEDGIFGSALRLCFKKAYRAYLPYALRHAPPERCGHNFENIRFEPFNANDIIMRLVLAFDGWPHADGAAALQTLGRYLKDLGALSPTAFVDFVGRVCRQAAGQQVLQAQRLLAEDRETPDYWIEDMQKYISSAQEAVTREDLCVPVDLEGSVSEKQALLQALTARYGALLSYWPAIVEAAREVKDDGQRVTVKV